MKKTLWLVFAGFLSCAPQATLLAACYECSLQNCPGGASQNHKIINWKCRDTGGQISCCDNEDVSGSYATCGGYHPYGCAYYYQGYYYNNSY